MKSYIKIIFFLFISTYSFSSSAEITTHSADLDGNGKIENIKVEPEGTEVGISVYTSDNKFVGKFSVPSHLEEVNFVNLNRDNCKQIVVWSHKKPYWTTLVIREFKNGALFQCFGGNTMCGIGADFESIPPTIIMGQTRIEQKSSPYVDELGWELYEWNRSGFIYKGVKKDIDTSKYRFK